MPEQAEEIECLRYELKETEDNLANIKNELIQNEQIKLAILSDISVLESQIENYKSQITELESNGFK